MKTLRNLEDRNEIGERLGLVRAESTRRWGKMSPHGMVCHLSDSFRGVMGEKALAVKPGTFGRGFMKWAALRLPLRVCNMYNLPRSTVNSRSCMSR